MADLRLPDLLRLIELAGLREQRHMDDMRRAVVRQYRQIALDEAAAQLRQALDAPNPRAAQARTKMVLKALDIAVKELGLPSARAEQIVRRAVQGRVQSVDELMRLQNPDLSFNDPREIQARAVGRARANMNRYWEREQKRFRDDAARTIRQAIRQGLPPERAADLLEKHLGVSRSRAVLIATDQMLTAAANADRQRQRDMGVETYLWRTVGDKRVRREHRVRNGKKYRWKDGGEYPGQAIRCRCRAVPVVGVVPKKSVPEAERRLGDMNSPATHTYEIDLPGMERHTNGIFLTEKGEAKSQFLMRIDAIQLVREAAQHADTNELWNAQGKAKVKFDDYVGILGDTGERTQYINLYRRGGKGKPYRLHGAPGRPPNED